MEWGSNRCAGLLIACSFMAACGGGSGSTPNPGRTTVAGNVALTTAGNLWQSTPGAAVRLVELDSTGTTTSILASTLADGAGSFRFELPAGRSIGLRLAVETTAASGERLRALALQDVVSLGPPSEAFAHALFSTAVVHAIGESDERLARFQNGATQMLALSPPLHSSLASVLEQYSALLEKDTVVRDALASLRSAGTLPATLGDVGGLFGIGEAIWNYDDTLLGPTVRRVTGHSLPGSYVATSEPVGGASTQTHGTRLTLRADGVSEEPFINASSLELAVAEVIGPEPIARFGLRIGETVDLIRVSNRPTISYSFDADGLPDRLSYASTLRVVGIESVSLAGTDVPVLRRERTYELSIALSAGGEIRIRQTQTEWAAPFCGVVREQSSTTITLPDGSSDVTDSRSTLTAGVFDSVSWPGRIRIEGAFRQTPFAFNAYPLALVDSNHFVEADVQPNAPPSITLNTVSALTGGQVASVRLADVNQDFFNRVVASPDGTKLFAVIGGHPVDSGTNVDASLPLAEAAARSATIVRLDARTLAEEVRVQLPPAPSALFPGRGFPRALVRDIAVSPADPRTFAVASVGLVLAQDSQITSILMPDVERFSGAGAFMTPDQVRLIGFDTARGSLMFDRSAGTPDGSLVSFDDQGLLPASLRGNGLPQLRTFGLPVSAYVNGSFDSVASSITTDALLLGQFNLAISKFDGRIITNNPFGVLGDRFSQPCRMQGLELACLTADGISLHSATDLRFLRLIDVQPAMRNNIGAITIAGSALFPVDTSRYMVVGRSTTDFMTIELPGYGGR